jgi:Pyridoxamine 5'-phosphate oxidase
VIDEKTIGFVDFAGNQQYITAGNLADNPKAYLFLIDYARRFRIKIWGTARVVEGDNELTAKLMISRQRTARNWSAAALPRVALPNLTPLPAGINFAALDLRLEDLLGQLRQLVERAPRGRQIVPVGTL